MDIRVNASYPDHPKTLRLSKLATGRPSEPARPEQIDAALARLSAAEQDESIPF